MYELKRFLYNSGKHWVEETVGGISWWWPTFYNGTPREVRVLKLIQSCTCIYKTTSDIWMCKNHRRAMLLKKSLLHGLGSPTSKVIFFLQILNNCLAFFTCKHTDTCYCTNSVVSYRDKAQLSKELGHFSKKHSEDYEHLDKISIQADMWRSKFLASR